jgi:hypothetical protein
MATGFNTEFKFNERVFHVQTEDKGIANPKIQTLVYVRGEILDSFQSDYSDLLENGSASENGVSRRMEEQHKNVVADIKNGKYETTPFSQVTSEGGVFSDRPLEEAIFEYLQNEGAVEALELILARPLAPKYGSSFDFSLTARLCNSKSPIVDAKVSVKLISNFEKPVELMTGKTDQHGKFTASVGLPPSQPGNCAILLSSVSEHGNDEIRAIISE